jgi:hypothetical protein
MRPPSGINLFASIGGILAFVAVVLLEATVFYLLGWASKWGSLLPSLVVNLVSTVLGWVPAVFGLVALDDLNKSVFPWTVLCALSTIIEGLLCIATVKQVGAALLGSLVTNVASYLLLMLLYMLVLG